jgi:hypothetical protein
MDIRLKLLAALVGIAFLAFVLLSVRASSIRPSFAWLWLSIAGFLVSVPLLEPLYKWVAVALIGVDDARTVVYVTVIGFLLVYTFRMTQALSRMSDRIQELITQAALLEARVAELRAERAPGDGIPS